MPIVSRIAAYIRMHGGLYTLRRAGEMLSERLLCSYHRAWLAQQPDADELALQRANQPDAGLISVVIPVYNTRPAFLQALADSLMAQTYQNWEAVLYDGCSTSAATLAALEALPRDDRLHIVHGQQNAGISGNTNLAIEQSHGAFVALCDHDDTLAHDALWRVAEAIAAHQPDMVYTDEDKLTENGLLHTDPHDKPDYCPDTLRANNYICHLMVIRRTVLDAVEGLRPDYDGSQDHDLALRVAEHTDRIVHIPRILYHWRRVGSSMSHRHQAVCMEAAARAVTDHMGRIGCPGTCVHEDGVLRLRYDVHQGLTLRTIRVSGPNRYADMNRAAAEASEEVLLFLDASVTLPDDALNEMLMYAQRDDVAAVTPMLTDSRGRVTHAGFALLGKKGPVTRNGGLPWHAGGWHGLNRTSHNVAAVSAACLMVRRDHFIPFDEGYRDGLGAVDWCLRQSQRGLWHVYTPHARAVCADKPLLSTWTDLPRFRAAWPDTRDGCFSAHHDATHGKFTHVNDEFTKEV